LCKRICKEFWEQEQVQFEFVYYISLKKLACYFKNNREFDLYSFVYKEIISSRTKKELSLERVIELLKKKNIESKLLWIFDGIYELEILKSDTQNCANYILNKLQESKPNEIVNSIVTTTSKNNNLRNCIEMKVYGLEKFERNLCIENNFPKVSDEIKTIIKSRVRTIILFNKIINIFSFFYNLSP